MSIESIPFCSIHLHIYDISFGIRQVVKQPNKKKKIERSIFQINFSCFDFIQMN